MNPFHQTILKLSFAGFKTRHMHDMLRFDSTLRFLDMRSEFDCFMQKTNYNHQKLLIKYAKYQKVSSEEIYRLLFKKNIKYVFYNEEGYPKLLKEIYDYPLVLYGLGDMKLLQNDRNIAVIGSRKATNYSRAICEKIIPNLIKYNFNIVSGMAIGADEYAHLTTIRNNGNTIGVAGFGLAYHYPKHTNDLSEYMRVNQLVISEYFPHTQIRKHQFPERNRIISGLSQGVLVTEASEKSGTLITVDQALDQNRNVYCCPGPIFNDLSIGVNKKIQEGAKLIQTADDILEDYS